VDTTVGILSNSLGMANRSKDMEGTRRRVEVDTISSNRLASKEEAWELPVRQLLVSVVVCSVAC